MAAEIRRAIAEGEAGPGERLPLAKDMAAVLGVNKTRFCVPCTSSEPKASSISSRAAASRWPELLNKASLSAGSVRWSSSVDHRATAPTR